MKKAPVPAKKAAKKAADTAPRVDVFEKMTNFFIKALEGGSIPWKKPWNASYGPARNYQSGHVYQGLNALFLSLSEGEYPLFLTFNQARELGGCVRKGEKGIPIIYANIYEKASKTPGGEAERIPFIKSSTVFNIGQIDGIAWTLPEQVSRPHTAHEEADKIVNRYLGETQAPSLIHGSSRAYYQKSLDKVVMPRPETFHNQEGYYATLFHELTHSTGHQRRLNRVDLVESAGFGTPTYAREELTAELGAAFLCAASGLDISVTVENHTAYLQSWLNALRGDKKLLFSASSQAQKATHLIMGTVPPHYEATPARKT